MEVHAQLSAPRQQTVLLSLCPDFEERRCASHLSFEVMRAILSSRCGKYIRRLTAVLENGSRGNLGKRMARLRKKKDSNMN
jgi:hypothetical protein